MHRNSSKRESEGLGCTSCTDVPCQLLFLLCLHTVLQSKRVDFEYGVFSAVFTGQTCMSRVIICYSVLSRIGLYISENMDCNYL